MLEQGYGEAWVTSMFQVSCQDHWPVLGLGLGFSLVVERGYCYI